MQQETAEVTIRVARLPRIMHIKQSHVTTVQSIRMLVTGKNSNCVLQKELNQLG